MRVRKSVADILADAREYMEENGWWRGALIGPNGRQVCARGAILRSQGWTTAESEAQPWLARVESRLITLLPSSTLTGWNDRVAKDKQEVLDLFAKAEKIERAGFDPDA